MSWLSKLPGGDIIEKQGGAILKNAGGITGTFGGASGAGDVAGKIVVGGAKGIDKGIAYMQGASIEDKIEKAAELIEKVGPEGIPVGSDRTGRIIQTAVGAGVDGGVGPNTMKDVNAYLVDRFAPKPETEAQQDPNMGPAESGVRAIGKGLSSIWSSAKEAVSGGDLAEKYPEIAKQVQDAIAATPAGQPPQVLGSRNEIAGIHMKFFFDELCDRNAFDGDKVLTSTAAEAIGNELSEAVAGTGLKGHGLELQAIGNSLAPELVKAPEGFKPQEAETAPEAEMSPK